MLVHDAVTKISLSSGPLKTFWSLGALLSRIVFSGRPLGSALSSRTIKPWKAYKAGRPCRSYFSPFRTGSPGWPPWTGLSSRRADRTEITGVGRRCSRDIGTYGTLWSCRAYWTRRGFLTCRTSRTRRTGEAYKPAWPRGALWAGGAERCVTWSSCWPLGTVRTGVADWTWSTIGSRVAVGAVSPWGTIRPLGAGIALMARDGTRRTLGALGTGGTRNESSDRSAAPIRTGRTLCRAGVALRSGYANRSRGALEAGGTSQSRGTVESIGTIGPNGTIGAAATLVTLLGVAFARSTSGTLRSGRSLGAIGSGKTRDTGIAVVSDGAGRTGEATKPSKACWALGSGDGAIGALRASRTSRPYGASTDAPCWT